jgi:hypothetical protein
MASRIATDSGFRSALSRGSTNAYSCGSKTISSSRTESLIKSQIDDNYHGLNGLTDTIPPFNISGMWPIGHGFPKPDVT